VREVAPLDAQYETISVLTKGAVVDAANAAKANLFRIFAPLDLKKLDRTQLQQVIDRSDSLMTKYLDQARAQLDRDREHGTDLVGHLFD
jgi:hypothetical protein